MSLLDCGCGKPAVTNCMTCYRLLCPGCKVARQRSSYGTHYSVSLCTDCVEREDQRRRLKRWPREHNQPTASDTLTRVSVVYKGEEGEMNDAALINLALCPMIVIPAKRGGRTWEKQCELCPQRFYDDCTELNLAGLPLRCQQKDAEEVAKLREALKCAQ